MKGKDFFQSKWYKQATDPQNYEKIETKFVDWSKKVKNLGIIEKAKQLYNFFVSPKISAKEKILVGAALLYIIAPLDFVPDYIPLIGWLDDLGVASFALKYVLSKMDKLEQEKTKKELGIVIDVEPEEVIMEKNIFKK